MGNKINPACYRLPINNNWFCKHSNNNIKKNVILFDDINNYINKIIGEFICNEIYLEILEKDLIITIYSIKPGLIIGHNGKNVNLIKEYLKKKYNFNAYLNIKESHILDHDFSFFFINLFNKIKNRENYKNFLKKNFDEILGDKIIGIKILISGRINGSDISNKEVYKKGVIPLQSYSSKIFYKNRHFMTKYGLIGIKIWFCCSNEFFKGKKL
ncbi:30S ribosomal protein S3 [Candidatus Vidania fulgoroideorum]